MPLTLADLTDKQRRHLETCIHEAGHAVAAVTLGGVIRSAVVASGRVLGVSGLTTVAEMPEGRSPEIAYSGPWAQACWLAGRRPTQREVFAVLATTGHRDDRVLLASGGTHTGHDAVPLLTHCWPAVVRVAQQLYKTGEATQADVLAALSVDDGGGLSSFQLANIRARLRSVPPIERAAVRKRKRGRAA
ncbi:M50 family metallopeptidase [Mycobacterium avium subsp. hominissuis]|uniref:M50 family metallopeptidase n=1 Tax=Mycobacterium avium TaxID=1764 RepID=UPI000BB0EDFB|nr:M50 family metallopeptidase [Mycobacterium avium]PBD11483.1 hypothetical protein BI295_19715 [Mycobacterium avium subsp. hominissuis]